MSTNLNQNSKLEIVEDSFVEASLLITKIKNGIWSLGIPSWVVGIADRGVASFADGYISAAEILQLLTATFLFVSWLYLKPEESWNITNIGEIETCWNDIYPRQNEVFLSTIKGRMLELQNQHKISQEYILPFPYICQIYHLLNLKHLENVHNFSLNNLKVIDVNYIRATDIGGMVKFQTVLDSPVNALRIWRQPIVEAKLILHTPYTVELKIPVYNGKNIIVIFNALPLNPQEHKFFIDIYTDLEWSRPLLQILFHFAACLTLFEDLPYLRQLATINTERLFTSSINSERKTMWLFRRFVELYGSKLEHTKALKASQ